MSGVRISNDVALENAIITSAKNPRHCLCYKEAMGDRITWATTMVNSNKIYRLPLSKSAEYSITVHEAIHQESIPRTYFKKRIILPIFDSSLKETEFLVEYNTQVRYFLETVAILGQVHVGSRKEFSEHLLNYIAGHEPHTLQLLNQIQDSARASDIATLRKEIEDRGTELRTRISGTVIPSRRARCIVTTPSYTKH